MDALKLVETRLNVKLDVRDAASIWTVGDLWTALLKNNANLQPDKPTWRRFVVALTAYTGLNPRQIGSETLLIEPKRPASLKRLWQHFRRGKPNA